MRGALPLVAVLVAAAVHLLPAGATRAAERPNVVLLVADDLGFDDIGLNNPISTTPHLDRLAAESVQFANFYVNAQCAPTRAALLTGRQFFRTGVWGVHGGRDYVNRRETMLQLVFRDNGYATGFMGKWHSGRGDRYYPWERGFDEAHMARLYAHNPELGAMDAANGEVVEIDGWAGEYLTDRALEFIDAHPEEPFFLYVSFMATHAFWRAPAALVEAQMAAGHSESLAVFLAMAQFMDRQIGRILERLESRGLDGNTVVVFFSDNGPIGAGGPRPPGEKGQYETKGKDWRARNPHGLRGGKGQMYENGIKSVLFVREGQRFAPHVVDEVTNVADLYPTLLDLAGLPLPADQLPLDGRSLEPLLAGRETGGEWDERSHFFAAPAPNGAIGKWGDGGDGIVQHPAVDKSRDAELFRFDNLDCAVRKGPLKFVQQGGESGLFNLVDDPREKNPITDQPEVAAALRAELQTWWAGILADPHTFQKPVQFVLSGERPARSVIYFAGADETFGNAAISALHTYGYRKPGDWLRLRATVEDAGKYRVFAHYTTTGVPTRARFEITLGDVRIPLEIDREFRERKEDGLFEFNPDELADLGVVDLPKMDDVELEVRLLENPVQRDAVQSLVFLVFEPVTD